VNRIYTLLAALLIVGCAGKDQVLVVKQFQLRDQDSGAVEDPMARMEKLRHLHGSVSMAERRNKLGQYYTLLWNDPAGAGQGEVKVTFRYQQGATASKVKEIVRRAPSSQASGNVEFAVIGDDYFNNGRVLAWQSQVERGGRVLATKQSYLWQ
jgi:uncharacterized protein YcfL